MPATEPKRVAARRSAKVKRTPEPRPVGRPTDYDPLYCGALVSFCRKGYSLAGFAGKIDVARSTLNKWAEVHPEFSEALERAKAARALWWEERGIAVAVTGGPGGQATMVIFGLKNHAPEDYRDATAVEHSGPDGGPIEHTIADKRAAAKALLDHAFGESGGET